MTETLKVAQSRTHRTSATNGQAIRWEVFQVGVRGQQHTQAQTKCISCGLWGARLSVDTERSFFTCNTRCMRRWQLDQIAACRRQEPTQKRGCGCGEKGPEEEGDPPSTHCNSGLTSVDSQLQQACAGCKAEAPTHPCARCWEVWYCSDECARAHWPQHQTQCQRGAWCGGCGNDGQSVWCEECNKAAYCSKECRERDRRDHHKECDGRWTQKRTLTEAEGRPHVASHFARDSGFEPIETPQEALPKDGRGVPEGSDQSVGDAPAEKALVHHVEELKDDVIDLVLSARQRDERGGEVSANARQCHEERCQKDAKRLKQLVAAFRRVTSVRHSITEEQLEHARHWARCCFEPWARQQREERLARRWREWEEIGWVRVRFRGLPATNSESACALLVEAGVCRVEDECHPVRFMMGQRRGSTCRITITEVTVLLNWAVAGSGWQWLAVAVEDALEQFIDNQIDD